MLPLSAFRACTSKNKSFHNQPQARATCAGDEQRGGHLPSRMHTRAVAALPVHGVNNSRLKSVLRMQCLEELDLSRCRCHASCPGDPANHPNCRWARAPTAHTCG